MPTSLAHEEAKTHGAQREQPPSLQASPKPQLFIFLMLLPAIAAANAGIPIGAYSLAWSVLLFMPIVVVEAWVLRGDLRLAYRRALATAFAANLLSTLAGIVVPVLTTPFGSTEGAVSSAVTLLLFVPLFHLSRTIEAAYTRWRLAGVDRAEIARSVNRVNLVSYAMLSVFVVTRFFKSWYVNGQIFW